MTLLINVQDDLARRLRTEAKNRSVTVENLALSILDQAVPPRPGEEDWGQRNQRRLELIRKSTREQLSEQEQAELDRLQGWLDERFEPFDAGLKAQLEEMKQAVTRLAGETSDE